MQKIFKKAIKNLQILNNLKSFRRTVCSLINEKKVKEKNSLSKIIQKIFNKKFFGIKLKKCLKTNCKNSCKKSTNFINKNFPAKIQQKLTQTILISLNFKVPNFKKKNFKLNKKTKLSKLKKN